MRSESFIEWRKEIGAENIGPETALDKLGGDQVFYFFMKRRRLAPVNSGAFMVHGMIPVIEEHLIEKAHEVARMIQIRFLIGMNMLYVIKNQNAEERNLMGNCNKDECFFPIEIKCDRI